MKAQKIVYYRNANGAPYEITIQPVSPSRLIRMLRNLKETYDSVVAEEKRRTYRLGLVEGRLSALLQLAASESGTAQVRAMLDGMKAGTDEEPIEVDAGEGR